MIFLNIYFSVSFDSCFISHSHIILSLTVANQLTEALYSGKNSLRVKWKYVKTVDYDHIH